MALSMQMRFRVLWVVTLAAAVSGLCGFWWGSAARLDPGVAAGAAATLFMVVLVWLALRAEQASEKHADVPDPVWSVTDFPSRPSTGQVQDEVNTGPDVHQADALFRLASDGDPLTEDVPEAPPALQPRAELMFALAFLAKRTGLADEAGARAGGQRSAGRGRRMRLPLDGSPCAGFWRSGRGADEAGAREWRAGLLPQWRRRRR
jgi:hypothetical protein